VDTTTPSRRVVRSTVEGLRLSVDRPLDFSIDFGPLTHRDWKLAEKAFGILQGG
jgi:hypothetical protein